MENRLIDNLKKVGKFLLFAVIFLCLYQGSREVLRNKSESEALGRIFLQPDEKYDVVLAGPSHIQYGIQPEILREKFSVSACNTATAAQSVPTSYYVIKEMIRRHTPKIVVMDLFCLFYPEEYFSVARFHQAIDNFPFGKTKIEAVEDLAKDDWEEFILNYMLYHGRWKTLKREDYMVLKEFDEEKQVLDAVSEFENDFQALDKSVVYDVPQTALEYLEKIVDLCKENDVELILTVIPYRADVDNNSVTGVYQQGIYNQVELYAKEWGVEFINMLHLLDEIGFDFKTDMAEFSHLNKSGSDKVTDYWGKILKERLE